MSPPPTLNVLNPDDKLMERFQRTLRAHLLHVDSRLSEEILDLEASAKEAERELESETAFLDETKREVERQQDTLHQCLEALSRVSQLREKKTKTVENAKETLKQSYSKLKEEKEKKEDLSRKLQNLLEFHSCLSKWEKDLADHLKVSKRMSSQDATRNKTLIERKRQRDFILYRLREEIWRIESEISYLDEQLQMKDREKEDASRMIIDANTDLESLHAEHKDLHGVWKSVVNVICKRNDVHDRLHVEQAEARKAYDRLQLEIQKVKKETEKEMESNEHLTSLTYRLENNAKGVARVIAACNEKIASVEFELLNVTKINEQTQHDYDITFTKYQSCAYEEEQATKKLEAAFERKNSLEDAMFKKLEEKVICDKTARYVNELLLNTKNAVLEYEISLARVENAYGNDLLRVEKLKNLLSTEKEELQELTQRNARKEKQIDDVEKEIKKYEAMTAKTQSRLLEINKLIDQILPSIGGEELSPQDLKLINLEKNIEKLQEGIKKTQQFWMRRQGFVVSLSQQREAQLQELNLLEKEIMIMGQRNLKLEFELQTLAKEEANTVKSIGLLEQKLSRINASLVVQKDLEREMEDQNCVAKNECLLSFQQFEMQVIKLQSELKNLRNEKVKLKDELKCAQQESLSWEKKVQLMQSTIRDAKEEQTGGGIAAMRSEIHRMEMRQSYLRKIQEKLIHDMELGVARRDIIVDKVFDRRKQNAKLKHNERVVMRKRLGDQRSKVRQLVKIAKQTANMAEKLRSEVASVEGKIAQGEEILRDENKRARETEEEIKQLELIKYHNLHGLVLKQRRVKQLQDIRSGVYRAMYKSESAIEEHLQTERYCRENLKCTLEKTERDFPLLRSNTPKKRSRMSEKHLGISQQTLVSDAESGTASAKKLPQYVASLASTLGALAAGMTLAWSSSAGEDGKDLKIDITPQEFSWVSSLTTIGSGVICIPIGMLADAIGRKTAMLLMVVPFLVGWLLIIFAQNVAMFYVGRFVTGLGGGAFCVAAPMYTAEISEKEIRGTLGSYFQLLLTVGILLSYACGTVLNIYQLSILSAVMPLVFFAVFVFMPESPIYYLKKGDEDAAAKSLRRLRGDGYDVQRELQGHKEALEEMRRNAASFCTVIKSKGTQRAFAVAAGLMIFQQLSGVNVVIFYTNMIFEKAGSDIDPGISTIIVGVMQVVAVFASSLIVDRLGRRVLLLASIIFLAITACALGVYFYMSDQHLSVDAIKWLPLTSLCVFILMFNMGFGPLPWMMVGELFTAEAKGVAGSTVCLLNWLLAFVVTKTFKDISDAITIGPTFWLFAVISVIGVFFVYFVVPETKGKTLEEIQEILEGR